MDSFKEFQKMRDLPSAHGRSESIPRTYSQLSPSQQPSRFLLIPYLVLHHASPNLGHAGPAETLLLQTMHKVKKTLRRGAIPTALPVSKRSLQPARGQPPAASRQAPPYSHGAPAMPDEAPKPRTKGQWPCRMLGSNNGRCSND